MAAKKNSHTWEEHPIDYSKKCKECGRLGSSSISHLCIICLGLAAYAEALAAKYPPPRKKGRKR